MVKEKTTFSDCASIIRLHGLEPFGVGGRRLCFVHPEDPTKCVKISRKDDKRTIRLKKSRFIPDGWRRAYDNNAHEQEELMALEHRIGRGMTAHFPLCYGMQKTDMGPGLVLDLIRDYDGAISRSIRELITVGFDLESLRSAFEEFGAFLERHLILTRKLCDHNLVVSMDPTGPRAIYLIDGFGDPAWLPVSRWIVAMGRTKVRRRVEDAWQNFELLKAKGGVSNELRRSSTWGQGMLNHRGS